MIDFAKIHFAFQNTVLFSVSALQEGDDNIQENSIQTLLICLDVPHGAVSVFWPEIWILVSESKALFYNTGCYSEIFACTNTIQFCTCLCKMHPWGILGGWRSSIPDWAEMGRCTSSCYFQWQESTDNCSRQTHFKEKFQHGGLLQVKGLKWKIKTPGRVAFCDTWEFPVFGTMRCL